MTFAAKNDTFTKIVTGIFGLIAIAGLIAPFIAGNEAFFCLPIGGIFAGVLFLGWFHKPSCYELTEAGLLIKRPVGTVKIARSRISGIEQVEPKRLRFAIRTFGIGGIFGYFGSFYTRYYGSMTWYVTDMKNPVMLFMEGKKKIVISPDDKMIFLAEIGKWIN